MPAGNPMSFPEPLRDPHGRPILNIRVSVTDRCNLNCTYCHNEGQPDSDLMMSPEEIGRVLKTASSLGVRTVKLTGGEPLLRSDILDIVKISSRVMAEVSMTTNGTLLPGMAEKLRASGLARLNVSLDTMDPVEYGKITGEDGLFRAVNGIREAVNAGISPVKINTVILPNTSLENVLDMVRRAWDIGAMPQIIQLINDGENGVIDDVEQHLSHLASQKRIRTMHHRCIYTINNREMGNGEVEVVRPRNNRDFCANCTRIRLTSGGMLKPCLMHNRGLVDILGTMREGADDRQLESLFKEAVSNREPYWKEGSSGTGK